MVYNLPLLTNLPKGPSGAAFIVVISFTLAFLTKFLSEGLLKILFKKTATKLDDEIISALKRPVFWSVFLLGIYFAAATLEPHEQILKTIYRLLMTVGYMIWTLAGLKILSLIFSQLKRRLAKKGKPTDAIPFLKNTAKVILIVTAILIGLSFWGINVTPLLASAGVFGIAIAFAAKDTISNLFGGISVFFDRPYKVGDYVIFADKHRGRVSQIGMRSTKIKTRDNVLLTIPNSVMVTDAVVNETGFDPKLRIRLPLSISYNENLQKVEEVLIEIMKKHTNVLTKPTPKVRYRDFGDSGIELEILSVIKTPPERGVTIHELIKEIHERFKKEGIEIPYPQRSVHLSNDEN